MKVFMQMRPWALPGIQRQDVNTAYIKERLLKLWKLQSRLRTWAVRWHSPEPDWSSASTCCCMLLACRQAHSQSNILSRKVKAKMNSSLAALLFLLVQQISAQLPTLNSVGPSRAPSPAPSPAGTITASANTSGSLGNYCSNQAGLNQLVQATATNAQPAGLSVTIPSTLQDASSLQSIAQVISLRWLVPRRMSLLPR